MRGSPDGKADAAAGKPVKQFAALAGFAAGMDLRGFNGHARRLARHFASHFQGILPRRRLVVFMMPAVRRRYAADVLRTNSRRNGLGPMGRQPSISHLVSVNL